MATDKTAFDDFLKQKLYRDITFRMVVWAAIAGLTASYASRDKAFTTVAYLQKVANGLMPVVNTIGVAAIVLSMIALVLKDLEHVAPANWGQATILGQLGGLVRRVAGDLGLWVVGALVTLLSAVIFLTLDAYQADAFTPDNVQAIILMYLVFMTFLVIMTVVNVLVRRSKPLLAASRPFSEMLTTAPRVIGFYMVALGAVYLSS